MPGQDEREVQKQMSRPTAIDLSREVEPPRTTNVRARRASGPPKDVKPIEFVHKESTPVRPVKEDGPDVVARWNSPDSLDERVRVSDDRVLKFRNGLLRVTDPSDDSALEVANQYVAGAYIRGDLDEPLISDLTNPPSKWYSREAFRRHQLKYKADRA